MFFLCSEMRSFVKCSSSQNPTRTFLKRAFLSFIFLIVYLAFVLFQGAGYAFAKEKDFEIFANLRARFESRNNSDFNSTIDDANQFVAQRWTVGVKYNSSKTPAVMQIRFARDKLSSLNFTYLYQLYFDLGKVLKFRLGRQSIQYGDSRIIADPPWSNVGRSFDGVRMMWTGKKHQCDLFALELVTPNGMAPAKPSYLLGNYNTFNLSKDNVLDVYYILKSQLNAGYNNGDYNVGSIGTRIKGKMNNLGYYAEIISQLGSNGNKTQSSLGYFFRLDYQLKMNWSPKFTIGRDFASGTAEPAGNTCNTYDPIYASAHKYYGYMDLVGMKNMKDLIFSLELKPSPNFTLSIDHHNFQLDKPKDAWYTTTGTVFLSDPTGGWGTSIGTELDVVATLANKQNTAILEAGYGHFIPASGIGTLRSQRGRSDPVDWFYTSLELKF